MVAEQKIKDIEAFYDYVSPVIVSILDKDYFIKDKEDFVTKCLALNQTRDIYSTFRKIEEKRTDENVILLKNFVIDVDNDPEGKKAKVFEEEYCPRYHLYIGAKVRSGGGYHFYIPYKETIVNNENREKLIQISQNFREHLLNNNVEVDPKIFNLSRLIRVWGSYNFKRQKLCELIYINNVTEKDIENNTLFINSLPPPQKVYKELRKNIKPTHCELFEYLKTHKLAKENVQKNDILIKNLACYLYETEGEAGFDEGVVITKLQGKAEAEFKGWWRKVVDNDFQYNHNEIYLWVRSYFPELIHLVSKSKKPIYTSGTESFNVLKQQILQHGTMVINKEVFLKGRVEPYLSNKKEELTILEQYEVVNKDKEVSYINCFIDNLNKPLNAKLINEIDIEFFVYNLIENGSSYLLLSEKPLDYGEYYIEGCVVKLRDDVLIGNFGKAKSRKKILFCHNSQSLLKRFKDAKEMFEYIKCTREQLLNYLFYHKAENKTYIEPEFVNDIIITILFSGKKSYPLHTLINGPQGCGKTSVAEAIFEKFDESNLDSGGASTIKNLVPSFGSSTPKLGSMLSAHRICFVDEFFGNIYQEQNNIQLLRMMNEILESRERRYGSGKGVIENAKMKAKLFSVTNPIEGTTFEETVKMCPETAIARLFIINLGETMTKWVNNKKHYIEGCINTGMDDYTWLSLYDFMNSFICKFDEKRVLEIVKKLEQQVPLYMRSVYNTRYKNHHSYLLLDGIVKQRCLFERDEAFEAKDIDYEKFEKLWMNLVENYSSVTDKIISHEQQVLLNIIGESVAYVEDLKKECERRNINYEYNIGVLKTRNLVMQDEGVIKKVTGQELTVEGL